jgi:uncharacterized protein YjbI with pentapeptide repeats
MSRVRRVAVSRFQLPAAFLLALAVAMLFAQAGGNAQAPVPLSPNPVPYTMGFLVTGDYAVGSVDVPKGMGPNATVTIPMSGVPANADILSAFLYWQTIAPTTMTPQVIADSVKFRGTPIKAGRVKATSEALVGDQSQCFVSGVPLTLTAFRADVLRLLPRLLDKDGKPTGKLLVNSADLTAKGLPQHTVTVPENSGNNPPDTAGASLVVVYRDLTLGVPLKKIVVHDGLYTQGMGETTVQKIGGFYRADPGNKKAKITQIVSSGSKNDEDTLTISTSPPTTVSNPFHGLDNSSDRNWDGATVLLDNKTLGANTPGFGDTITSTVTHTKTNPYDCLTWSATWFSTTVQDADHDGLPDRLEESGGPLKDPNGVALPNLFAMNSAGGAVGARTGVKDIFIEVNALRTQAADTPYGSASAPYESGAGPDGKLGTADDLPQAQRLVTDHAPPHNHMPTPEVIKLFGDAYKALVPQIRAHVDVGNLATYKGLGTEYNSAAADEYLIATGAAGGELTDEAACSPSDPSCHFPDYPGTLGWGFALQKHILGTDVDPTGNSPRFDKNRYGLVHLVVYTHMRGKPKSLPCIDASGGFTIYDNPTTQMCAVAANPNFEPLDYHVPTSSSGAGDLPGWKAIISLGRWEGRLGTPFVRASTTFHELGHHLGLWHGGGAAKLQNTQQGLVKSVEPNGKSNYLSIMNYLFQSRGLLSDSTVPPTARIALSSAAISPQIKEGSLKDLAFGALPYRTAWFVPLHPGVQPPPTLADALGLTPRDRLLNGLPLPAGVSMARFDALDSSGNMDWATNGFVINQSAAGQDVNLDGLTNTEMSGFNDVLNIRLDQVGGGHSMGGAISNGGSDFGGSDFGGSDFGGSDFGGSDFGGSDFGGSDFGGSDFGGLDLDGSDFGGSDFGGSDFGGQLGGDPELTHEAADGDSPPNELFACVLGGNLPAPRTGVGIPACTGATSPLHRVQATWKAPNVGDVALYHLFRVTGSTVGAGSVPVEILPALTPAAAGCATLGQTCTQVDGEELPDGLQFTYYVKADLTTNKKTPNSNFSTITARNDAPLAIADAQSVNEDGTLVASVLPNDSDADSAVLQPVRQANPVNGGLTFNTNGTYTYIPNADFYGTDSFSYKLVAATWPGPPSQPVSPDSATVFVTVTVNPVNDPPSFTKGPDQAVLEDSKDVGAPAGSHTVPGWATNIRVGPAGSLAATNESNGACVPHVATVCDQTVDSFLVTDNDTTNKLFLVHPAVAPNGALTYTLKPDAYGSAVVTVRAHDTGGGIAPNVDTSAAQTLTITVTPVNDAPSFTKGPDQTVAEESGAHTVPNWATAISVGPPNENDGSCSPAGSVVCNQVPDFIVSNNNSALFLSPPAISAAGQLTYTSAPDANGTATVTVQVHDNGGVATGGVDTSAAQTFTITVTEVNDAPEATDDTKQMDEDCSATAATACVTPLSFPAADLIANDSKGPANESAQTLTVESVSSTTSTHGSVSLSGPNGTVTYTPDPNFHGQASFTYHVCDDGTTAGLPAALCDDGTVFVDVASVNDTPVGVDDTANTSMDTAVTIAVLTNDTDVDGDTLAAANPTTPTHGGVVVNANNTITYTPAAGFTGTDGFDYDVDDGHGGTDTAHVTVYVGNSVVVAARVSSGSTTGAVHVLNLDAGTSSSLSLPSDTIDVAVTPDRTKAVVSGFNDHTVKILDITTSPPTVLATVTTPMAAEDIDVDSSGQFAVVADGGSATTVSSINISGGTIVNTLTLPDSAEGITFVPNRGILLVNSYVSNLVRVLTISGNGSLVDMGTSVAVGPNPLNIQPSPDGGLALMPQLGGGGSIGILHIPTAASVTYVGTVTPAPGKSLAGAQSIAFNAAGTKAYVALTNGEVAVLDISGSSGLQTVTDSGVRIGGTGTRTSFYGVDQITTTPSYVVVHGYGIVTVIDPVTNTVLGTVTIPNDGEAGGIAAIK